MGNAECILYGTFVDGCKEETITYDWGENTTSP